MLRGTSGISASNKPHSTAGEKTCGPKPKLQGMPAFKDMEGKWVWGRSRWRKGRLVVGIRKSKRAEFQGEIMGKCQMQLRDQAK